ncbi:MAG: MASE1 domain-containing protein, partial [Gemmatimonadota bacterium]
MSLALASVNPSASAVWPPSGIALAATLLFGLRVWPAILVGAFFVNVTTAGSLATSVGIATGNTLEAVIGAWLVNRFAGGTAAFERPQGVLRFAVLILLSTTVSASIGVQSLWAGGFAESSQVPLIWLTWWLGDVGGTLVFTPFIVLWVRPGRAEITGGRALEAAALSATLIATAWFVFNRLDPAAFALLPPLVWAALRFGRRGAMTAAVATSWIALWGTLEGQG